MEGDELIAEKLVDYVYNMIITGGINEVHMLPVAPIDPVSPCECVLLEGNQLGLPVNICKLLYTYLYHTTLQACLSTQSRDIAKWTCILLMVNSSCPVFWNKRKHLCLEDTISLEEEMCVTRLFLQTHYKSAALYEHRRWLLSHVGFADTELLPKELELCTLTADKYACNYYSWSHRQWCINQCTNAKVYRADLNILRKWREVHVSQYCAFSYSQLLLTKLHLQVADLLYEYKDVTSLIELYQNHQSLWYHRKWVVWQLSKCEDQRAKDIVSRELRPLQHGDDYYTQRYIKGLNILLKTD